MSMREEGHFREFFILHLIMIFNLFMLTLDLYSFLPESLYDWFAHRIRFECWGSRLRFLLIFKWSGVFARMKELDERDRRKPCLEHGNKFDSRRFCFIRYLGWENWHLFCLVLGCHTNKNLWMAFVDRIV